jgi:eukaryotic-like serine/threonine-protein kinase
VEPGQRIADKYELVRQIGVGGMGEVWAAHHARIDRHVAIKFPNVDLVKRPEIRERFLAEARVLGRLRHPNIVDVIDFGELDDDGLYLVFELLDGTSLDAYVQEMGRLASRNAVRIAVELVRGLAFAHQANVIHRDLKPANVFMHRAPDGRMQVKLLDFGISKTCSVDDENISLTGTDAVVGTPAYMSYEQAKALPDVDARSDIWNVGVILYEMLSGLPPFEARTYSATVAKIVSEAVPPMSTWGAMVPPELEAIVQRCLAKDRDRRFQSAIALQNALEELLPRLSEPPASRRLQLDSLTDLPSMPPPPHITPPSAPSSSLRLYSPCALTMESDARLSDPRLSQVTPNPTNVTISEPPSHKPRALSLFVGAIALLALGAGGASLAYYALPSAERNVAGANLPATGVEPASVQSAAKPSAIPAPSQSGSATPVSSVAGTAARIETPKAETPPTAVPKATGRSSTTKARSKRRPSTRVDDPGF